MFWNKLRFTKEMSKEDLVLGIIQHFKSNTKKCMNKNKQIILFHSPDTNLQNVTDKTFSQIPKFSAFSWLLKNFYSQNSQATFRQHHFASPGGRYTICNGVKAKCRVKRLFESGVGAADVLLHIEGECVERQRASRPIQKDSYLGEILEAYRSKSFCIVVQQFSQHVRSVGENPGLVVFPKITNSTYPPSAYSPVSDTKFKVLFKLDLPVTTTSQTIPAEHLLAAVKSLLMEGVGLLRLLLKCHPSVVLRQDQPSVSCVRVQSELAGIQWRGGRK